MFQALWRESGDRMFCGTATSARPAAADQTTFREFDDAVQREHGDTQGCEVERGLLHRHWSAPAPGARRGRTAELGGLVGLDVFQPIEYVSADLQVRDPDALPSPALKCPGRHSPPA